MSKFLSLFERFNIPISLRRGDTILPIQSFRVESHGRYSNLAVLQDQTAQASKATVVLLGLANSDILPGDRFTLGESVYMVMMIKPPSFMANDVVIAFADLRQ